MRNITLEMVNIFNVRNRDWLNFYIDNINELTYHHIIKVEDNGPTSIDNGAPLTRQSHDYLHLIESLDINIYNDINRILKSINIGRHNPTKNQKKMIELLFLKFEYKYSCELVKGKYSITKKKNMAANIRKNKQKYIDKLK